MNDKPMGWGTIVALTALTAIGTGVIVGVLRSTMGLSGGVGGAGAATGIVAAYLIARRRAAIAARR